MIKVIASDMDGTLLGDNHKVAPETVEAIREAHLLKILVWKEMHMQENGIVRSVFFRMIRSRHSVREVQK